MAKSNYQCTERIIIIGNQHAHHDAVSLAGMVAHWSLPVVVVGIQLGPSRVNQRSGGFSHSRGLEAVSPGGVPLEPVLNVHGAGGGEGDLRHELVHDWVVVDRLHRQTSAYQKKKNQ
jgi:hypothetical protein